MTIATYNNVGIPTLAIAFTLANISNRKLPLSKAVLLMPFLMNKDLLAYLGHGAVKVKSLEKLIIENPGYFSKFNDFFYDSLSSSINAIQFLVELESVQIIDSDLILLKEIAYENSMGQRAKKINNAAPNLAKLMEDSLEKLYLNLRIEV